MENTVKAPTVIGMSAAQAEVILEAAGLTHSETAPEKPQPPGMVTSQSPAVGARVPPKTTIHLTFAPLTAS
jgi:beta-lactam-binding protein with PASTA domain